MKRILAMALTAGIVLSFSTTSLGVDSLSSKCGHPPKICAIIV